jgi:hypothetical protein
MQAARSFDHFTIRLRFSAPDNIKPFSCFYETWSNDHAIAGYIFVKLAISGGSMTGVLTSDLKHFIFQCKSLNYVKHCVELGDRVREIEAVIECACEADWRNTNYGPFHYCKSRRKVSWTCNTRWRDEEDIPNFSLKTLRKLVESWVGP